MNTLSRWDFWRWLLAAAGLMLGGARGGQAEEESRWSRGFGEPGLTSAVHAMIADGNRVFVGGDFGLRLWDGQAWSGLGGDVDGAVYALARVEEGIVVGGRFDRVGSVVARNIALWDGQHWHPLGSGVDAPVFAVAGGLGTVVATGNFREAGGVPVRFVARWEFGEWHALGGDEAEGLDSSGEAIALGPGGEVVVAGWFTEAGGAPALGVAAWDGTTWSAWGDGLEREGLAGPMPGQGLALGRDEEGWWVAGQFVRAGGVTVNHVARWDGHAWSALGDGLLGPPGSPNTQVPALVRTREGWVAAGEFARSGDRPVVGLARWDGAAWQPWADGGEPQGGVSRLATTSDGALYLGGRFTRLGAAVTGLGIARFREGRFEALGDGVVGRVLTLVPDGDEAVLAGGQFAHGGGQILGGVGRWTGHHWEALGEGVEGVVHAATRLADGSVVVGGGLESAGGEAVRGLARWDGRSWSGWDPPLGGPNVEVTAMAPAGAGFFVGGGFTEAGGIPTRNVGYWNGSAWESLGTPEVQGVNGRVETLVVQGDDLFVGGWFTEAGGQPATGLARWRRREGRWEGSTGLDPFVGSETVAVHALAPWQGGIVLGGRFRVAGDGGTAGHLAFWDGQHVGPVGGRIEVSLGGTVHALAVDGADLYVGGNFEQAGGALAPGVARWNAAGGWASLEEGIVSPVRALAVAGRRLVAGGEFQRAGRVPSHGLAEWRIEATEPALIWTSPSPGAVVPAGEPIPMQVDLLRLDPATVARVEFYRGLAVLGSASEPPFAWTWTTARPGEHDLRAVAVRGDGRTVESGVRLVIVAPPLDNLPPQVSLVSPTNQQVLVRGEAWTLQATALDLDGEVVRVEFLVGQEQVGVATRAPYRVPGPPRAAGVHEAWARAHDDAGAVGVSPSVRFVVREPNLPPIVEFVAPREPVYEQPAPVVFVARAEDYDGELLSVEFGVDDRVLVQLPPRPDWAEYRYSWTNAPVGTYQPWVVAIDREGAITRQELPAFRVEPPNQPPVVRLVRPNAGQILTGPTNLVVRLEASDPDGEVVEVRLWVDETLAGHAPGPVADLVLTNLTDGTYCLAGEVTDNRGATVRTEALCITVVTRAERYRMVDLGAWTGTRDSRAEAINVHGEVTGYAPMGDVADKAFGMAHHPVLGTRFQFMPDPVGAAPSSIVRTYGFAINRHGEVAGFASGIGDQDVAVRFGVAGSEILGSLDGSGGRATALGINDRGDIVGRSYADLGEGPRTLAFVVQDGVMRALPAAGVGTSEAVAINDQGWIAGTMEGIGGRQAFLYEAGSGAAALTGLGLPGPGYAASEATSINRHRQVAGAAWPLQGERRAFIHADGAWRALGSLGGGSGVALDLNDHALVVGHSINYRTERHACLWIDDVAHDLNHLVVGPAPLRLIEATGINDRGWIVAWGVRVVGNQEQRRAALLLPSPVVAAPDPPVLNRQTGLFEHRVSFQVPGPNPHPVARLLLGDLPPGIEFRQARNGADGAYVEAEGPWEPGDIVSFVLEYFAADRRPFTPPILLADLTPPAVLAKAGAGVPVVTRVLRLRDGAVLVEFPTLAGREYLVETSDDAERWWTVSPPVTGTGQRVQWLDQGPPKTPPRTAAQRFYRVFLVPGTADERP